MGIGNPTLWWGAPSSLSNIVWACQDRLLLHAKPRYPQLQAFDPRPDQNLCAWCSRLHWGADIPHMLREAQHQNIFAPSQTGTVIMSPWNTWQHHWLDCTHQADMHSSAYSRNHPAKICLRCDLWDQWWHWKSFLWKRSFPRGSTNQSRSHEVRERKDRRCKVFEMNPWKRQTQYS